MEFNTFQKACLDTAIYRDKIQKAFPNLPKDVEDTLALSYAALGLGEAGEIHNKVKKIIRDEGCIVTLEKKMEICKELGDLLYYVAATCSELDMELNIVAEMNIEKLQSRKVRGKLTGDGDDR